MVYNEDMKIAILRDQNTNEGSYFEYEMKEANESDLISKGRPRQVDAILMLK